MTAIGKKAWVSLLMISFSCGLQPLAKADDEQAVIAIKAVVVTMFEHGELAGDRPGEFQFWVERFPLDQQLPFEMGQHPLRLSASGGVRRLYWWGRYQCHSIDHGLGFGSEV
jgi:purine nucleoside permease